MADFVEDYEFTDEPMQPHPVNGGLSGLNSAVPVALDGFGEAQEEQHPQDNGYAQAQDDFFSQPTGPMDAGPPTNDPSALEADDPRLVWYRRNADALVAREKAEKEAKENLLKKAQQFLEKAEEARKSGVSKRKKDNRQAEKSSNVAAGAVPTGNTPWERTISVINFNAEGPTKDPFKEMSRFKTVLLACKKANIAVTA